MKAQRNPMFYKDGDGGAGIDVHVDWENETTGRDEEVFSSAIADPSIEH